MTVLIWSLFFVGFMGWFAYQIHGRWKLLCAARKDDGRDYSQKTLKERIRNTVVYAFGQYKFFRGDQPAGVMHTLIFWGFIILGLQVVTMFLRGWFPSFYLPLFETTFIGLIYTWLKDFIEVGVFFAVSIALYRWVISKPKRLYGILPAEKKLSEQSHWEAIVILLFIMSIMVSGLFYDAARIVLGTESHSTPITAGLASLFTGQPALAESVSCISWWIHNVVILIFLNLLPRSKHFHIITAVPNVFFGRVDPKGKLHKKDYEAEEALFGRSQANHFTWKQVLDMFSCTECGRCSSFCPAAATHKTLAPRQMLINLRDTLYGQQSQLVAAAAGAEFDVVVGDDKAVSDDVVWSCVACRACEEACPVNIEYVDKIVDMRQHLVQEVSRFPEELNRAFKGLENNSNPWGISSDERAAWAEGLDVPTIQEKPNPEYLYYVGCGGSFDANNKKATQSFVKVLKGAGVDFAILGRDEMCNGETARRLGNEYLYQTMAEMLAAKINETGIKKLIVNCPHCFNTLKNEFPDFGGDWEVIHAAKLVNELVEKQKVKLQCPMPKNVVYHDSCYYGRFNDIYDEPRDLIKKIPETQLTEMNFHRHEGTCCGAGGGRMWMEEDKDKRVNFLRTDQAMEKKPDVIATSCPFCKIMMTSAVNEKGIEDKVKVYDVMELVEQSTQST